MWLLFMVELLHCLHGNTPGSNFGGGGMVQRGCWVCIEELLAMPGNWYGHRQEGWYLSVQLTNELILAFCSFMLTISLQGTKRPTNSTLGWLKRIECTHSTTYDINRANPLMKLFGFNIAKCFPYDIMHSIFEGVAHLHLNCLLRYLIDSASCSISIELRSITTWILQTTTCQT